MMKILKIGNPIIPRNIKDPAGQFGNLRNANAKLNKRYNNIKRAVTGVIKELEPVIVTNAAVYDYQVDTQKFNSINLFLQKLLYGELLDDQGGDLTNRWWLRGSLSEAFENGTGDTLQSSKNIATIDAVGPELSQQVRGIQLESIIFSPEYQNRVALVHSRVFENMKGLTDSTKSDLSDALARGMASGKGIRALTKDVMKRIDVSHSRAKRIARTETLNAYRTATNEETDKLNKDVYDDSDWGMAMLWFSALSPTTRKIHAVRHSNTYSTQEVKEFYSKDGNAIFCLCSQSPVLQNKKTGKILQKPLQERMEKQKGTWQKTYGTV